jgi:hypothetical protein
MRRGCSAVKGRHRWASPTALLVLAGSVAALLGGPALADGCPAETERVRGSEPLAQRLPDCRAYEQVSPVDKNTTDAAGRPGHVQSSPTGESVAYYSVVPFPDTSGSSEYPYYLSIRGTTSWLTQGLLPLVEPYTQAEVKGLEDDNNEAIVYVRREEGLLLAPGAKAGEGNLYVHNNVTGEYRLIAVGVGEATFADATPDGSRVLFTAILEEGRELAGITDPEFVPYLFEWDRETGQVSFVGVVHEGEEPKGGVVAGSNEHEGENTYDQDTLSEDGSRIFFSEKEGERKVYMREPDVSPPRTVAVSAGPARWRAATPNGSEAFYTEGENLYEFNVEQMTRNPIAEGAGVLGLVGISGDGSYAYFVAEGVIPGENEGKATAGLPNLYEWHEGASTPIRFISTFNSLYDESDWRGFVRNEEGTAAQGYMASRVSTDGTKVLFSSVERLTEYDNAGLDEIYLYDATKAVSATNPRCVSCNPTGVEAKKNTFLAENSIGFAPSALNAFMTRNMSANGTRIFFQTEERLLPQANGQMNVYEWEQEGVGSCGGGEGDGSGGCLFLISTGQSTSASYFGDASENGSDVLFFTRQSLVAQDQDNNVDVYDAREDGGFESQNEAPVSQCSGEGCRGVSVSSPAFGAPSSTTLSGSGNVAPQASLPPVVVKPKPKPAKCKQGFVKKERRCVKRPKHRKKGKASARTRRASR